MNGVDYGIIAIVLITLISGMHRGFIGSVIACVNFVLAAIAAFAFYGVASDAVMNNEQIVRTLNYYTDVSSKLGTGVARTSIWNASASTITNALNAISLPEPFSSLLNRNLTGQLLSDLGLSTIGEYVNHTIVSVCVDILAFMVILIVSYIVLNVVVSLLGAVFKFPMLRHGDALMGGAFGIARGYLFVSVLFLLIPILLAAFPVDAISEYIAASRFGGYFLNSNVIMNLLKQSM